MATTEVLAGGQVPPLVTGLQHLPRELLQKILVPVREAAVDENGGHLEDEDWREGFLVPLRTMCRSFRDVVDAGLTARTLSVQPASPHDACTLLRVTDWLRHSHRPWPNLTTLHLHLDWPADYLHFALLTLAGHCTLLTRLHLNTGYVGTLKDNNTGNLDIGVLHGLRDLSTLSLHGFSRYCGGWGAGLGELTSVKELDLVNSGLTHFTSWPGLERLSIDGGECPKQELEERKLFALYLEDGLCHLSLSHLSLCGPEAPLTLGTLELRGVVYILVDDEGFLPNLTSLKVWDVDSYMVVDCIHLSDKLRTLKVENIDFDRIDWNNPSHIPSLTRLVSLTSLVWNGNHKDNNSIPLPLGISGLTRLQELVLSDSSSGVLPPLNALTCLQKLSISKMSQVTGWPELTNLVCLTQLKLSHNHCQAGLPYDLSALLTLEFLVIEKFEPRYERFSPDNNLSLLTRLKTLTLSEFTKVTALPDLKPLASLQTLHLSKMKDLKVAPLLPSNLTSLYIGHCPVFSRLPVLTPGTPLCKLTLQHLPHFLVSQVTALTSLQELSILDFPNLPALPCLQSLGMLKSLKASRCPLLKAKSWRQTMVRLVEVTECGTCA